MKHDALFLNHIVVNYIIIFEMCLPFNLNGAKSGCILLNLIVVGYIIFFEMGFLQTSKSNGVKCGFIPNQKNIKKKKVKAIGVGRITF